MGSSGGGSGGGDTTVTNRVELPGWAQGYAEQFLRDVAGYVNQGLSGPYPFPGRQLYGFTPPQIAGMNLGVETALGADPRALLPALGDVAATQSGEFLNPASNPWLRQTFNAASQPVVTAFRDATEPGIQAEFARAGSFGGSAQNQAEGIAQQDLGRTLSNLATGIYGGNYEQERQNMIRQQALIPGLLQAGLLPSQELMDIGGAQQQFGQQGLDTALTNIENRYNFPFSLLAQLGGAIPTAVGNAYVSQQTGPNPNAIDPLSAGLAGGLGGLGFLGELGGGGGILGGLSTLLGFLGL